jgi:Mg2+ and Co2+ transporter CorA
LLTALEWGTDLLESLELEMINAPEPTDNHIQTSFKLKRRVHSLRRYAWNARQLLQELRQNNFGVLPPGTIKMMTSVERNSENMVEVACAYMDQCSAIEAFYLSFQEKLQVRISPTASGII